MAAPLLSGTARGESRLLHVDARAGSDKNSGTLDNPLRTISRAIAMAKPGDIVQLQPGQPPIHQEVKINAHSGTSDHPIILDGGGNILDGSQPITPEEWELVKPGLYRRIDFPGFKHRGESHQAMLRRFYFAFDGKTQRMQRAGKGANAPLPPPERLNEGEWTYVEAERAFYLRIRAEQTLADVAITYPALLNGVSTRGDCEYWIIRNLHVRRFLNDGFNLHGKTNHFRLEKSSAEECGDDGLSAHGHCVFEVHQFTASGNTTGICHIASSQGTHSALRLYDNVTYNLCLLGDGAHSFKDSTISAHGASIRFGTKGQEGLRVHLERVEILWPPEGAPPQKSLEVHPGVRISTSEMPNLPTF